MSQRYQGGILGVGFNPLQAPNAPTIGTATSSTATTASVAFTAPANVGGSAITSYVVESIPGGISAVGSSSPITVSGLTTGTAYTFRVTALNSYGPSPASAVSNSVTPTAAPGQQAYTTAGTYSWVAPAGVTSVCVVCVGGGGGGAYGNAVSGGGSGGNLRYVNNISVTPGASYTVIVGVGGAKGTSTNGSPGGDSSFGASLVVAKGGTGGSDTVVSSPTTGNVGTGGNGGNGGGGGSYDGGAGGAGGYSGNGGAGGNGVGDSGSSGSGGGGGGGGGGAGGAGGGGVGILGEGASGSGGAEGTRGGGGSGGAGGGSGSQGGAYQTGGAYGGGSGGGYAGTRPGGVGAVRIIWGAGRAFPSTNTGNL